MKDKLLKYKTDVIYHQEYIVDEAINKTEHNHSPIWYNDVSILRGACCLSCGAAVYTNLARSRYKIHKDNKNDSYGSHTVHCSNIECENNSGSWCEKVIENTVLMFDESGIKTSENPYMPDWVVRVNIDVDIDYKYIGEKFSKEIQNSHGNLVLADSGEVKVLFGLGVDSMDYYYILHDGKRFVYHSAVGGFTDLKDILPEDDYNRRMNVYKLNSNTEIPSEPRCIWIG